jgi:uncharacterized membrane protein YkgB
MVEEDNSGAPPQAYSPRLAWRRTSAERALVRVLLPGRAMNALLKLLDKLGLLKGDLDYHLVRASMVLIFLFFGYQKWFPYEAQALIPFISNGPLISWMYPAFGLRGASWFLGVSEWLIAALLFLGFWNKKAGMLGAIGGIVSFLSTTTIIPFMPDGWAASAGGFPAMTEKVAFLMKDLVLLAVSFYLLKQDAARASTSVPEPRERQPVGHPAEAAAGGRAATPA